MYRYNGGTDKKTPDKIISPKDEGNHILIFFPCARFYCYL